MKTKIHLLNGMQLNYSIEKTTYMPLQLNIYFRIGSQTKRYNATVER
jgi:hypothetical protein